MDYNHKYQPHYFVADKKEPVNPANPVKRV